MDEGYCVVLALLSGGISALVTCGFVYTYLYEQIKHLQMQVLALRVELNKGYDE